MMSDALKIRLMQQTPIPLDVAFTCNAGEVLALVGPSGSGKSTILRAIAGLTVPTGGLVTLGDGTWFDAVQGINRSVQSRRVGMVFQDYALFPHLSALANIALAMGHLPQNKRDQAARAMLARVNLAGLEGRRPAQLSGGQRQRVALARALARDPGVLLLDEPFAAVDQVTRRRLQDELVDMRATLNVPTILVTHDLNEARNLGDRICVLHQGRTLQTGPPEDVLNRPTTPLVARLVDLGNIFPGRIAGHDPDAGVTAIEWQGTTVFSRHRPEFPEGADISWVVPPSFVVLHRGDRPSRGERENPVIGTVSGVRTMGDMAMVSMTPGNDGQNRLTFSIASHAARRNALAVGGEITVSLVADGVHIMPPEEG